MHRVGKFLEVEECRRERNRLAEERVDPHFAATLARRHESEAGWTQDPVELRQIATTSYEPLRKLHSTLTVWLDPVHDGREPDGPNRLAAVVFEVADLERSVALYKTGFGLDLHRSDHEGDDRWTNGAHEAVSWSDSVFVHFALYATKDGTATTRAQVGFAVDDLDAAHRRATDAGAEVVHGPRAQPWGVSARYRDPDGNVVELTQRA